jgi:hypothetical protein
VATPSAYITNGVVTLGGVVVSNVVAIAAGTDRFSLALRSDGTVVGWGFAPLGATTPPSGLTDVVAIGAGTDFGLALKGDGSVKAWGQSLQGATQVPTGLSNVVSIAAATDTCLALSGTAEPPLQGLVFNPEKTANSFRAIVKSQSGRVYSLEYTSSLSSSLWTRLPLVAGNGASLTLIDPNPTDSQRFYRVRRW